ncbi:MAG: type I glyceraldehyde-3-phosphate dehydrogenase, partial [Candidatus Atribacteria bacterium]|nr:type I glyceraldehyde-3-phosphate dehydrogenase [Candidatus Atribacteria bacterium]
GAKKVIITAPAKGEEEKDGRIILLGINENEINNFEVVSNGSCTTNAVSPVLAVLEEKIGIKKAILNTVHAYTATQNLVDGQTKGDDFLRGRAAAQNIVPSTTGAAKTISKAIKNLEGKFDGLAIRVPVSCGSLADITFVSQKETSVAEINEILVKASKEEKWRNILGVSNEPLVSSDVIKDMRPAIVDLTFTKVVDKDLVKVLVWYDNEWGYAWTLLEQIKRLNIK